jgi:hypothetical protein
LYHEKRIALVNNFVCLVPLKNIVQGRKRKGYSKVEKIFPWKSYFPLFYLWDRKVEQNFPRDISFPHSNILLFPGTIFFSGSRKQKCSPGTNTVFYTSKNPKIAYFCLLKTAAKFS